MTDVLFITALYEIDAIVEFGVVDEYLAATRRGVRVHCITDISSTNLDAVSAVMNDIKVRHNDKYHVIRFLVADPKENFTLVTFDPTRRVTDPLNAWFWTNSSEYADYQRDNFELVWEQLVDAAEWIEKMSGEGTHSLERYGWTINMVCSGVDQCRVLQLWGIRKKVSSNYVCSFGSG